MNFNFRYRFQETIPPEEPAYWFIFRNGKILTLTEGTATKPLLIRTRELPQLNIEKALHIGELDRIDCYALFDETEKGIEIPHSEWVSLRLGYGKFSEEMFQIYGRAAELLVWASQNRFCGRCGAPLALKADERCFQCPACRFISYPRISPAIIVAIEKEGKLLLARGARFQSEIYSVLAGFVEPGETLEECIRREVREEVGIEIKNIRYFKSQPWPFPDSLMIAFTAEYAGGELTIDPTEIVDAGWYSPEDFPPIPGKFAIARALIDHFLEKRNAPARP
ncbi:MAG: NAD(+) diphosphatase [Deltaproteobacteria bacterium]|nr:NAD(+) diphosphatase [Deltaproteobacteria bacterium]